MKIKFKEENKMVSQSSFTSKKWTVLREPMQNGVKPVGADCQGKHCGHILNAGCPYFPERNGWEWTGTQP